MAPELTCRKLDVLRPRPVLEQVSVTLPGGRIHALCGPNGAGKSTLLAACAGDLPPSSGEVMLGETPVHRLSLRARAQCRAVLTQNPELDHPFTCRQVINLGQPDASASPNRIDSLLAELGCQDLEQRVYTRVSGGEQRLIHFLRVLAQAEAAAAAGFAPWLLLDEPTSQLDLGRVDRVLACLRARAERGWGIVVALHDLELASRSADHLLLLAGGRLLADGAPSAVLTTANLRAGWGIEALVAPAVGNQGLQIRTLPPPGTVSRP